MKDKHANCPGNGTKHEETLSRRRFLKGVSGAVGSICILVSGLADSEERKTPTRRKRLPMHGEKYDWNKYTWAFVVDSTKCIGCGACVRACSEENKVPDGQFRTWVERYEITVDRQVHVDSPDGALHGFEKSKSDPKKVIKSFFVPKLCNHCEKPPCVQVCPVGATFKTKDGVVLVDPKQCVGCGYCLQACPYGARFLNETTKTADKCTLCYHRITKGLQPACVEVCPVGARQCGNLKDPKSNISLVVRQHRYGVLKQELGAEPKCFYVGLDPEVI